MQRATQGRIRILTGTVPAAGAEYTETVPGSVRWRLISIKMLYTTVGVANRTVNFIIDDGTNTFYRNQLAYLITAGLAETIVLAPGLTQTTALPASLINFAQIPMDLILLPGFRFSTSTTNIQAGDTYTAIFWEIEEIPN